MIYLITKQLEKVVEFSLSKPYRDFKGDLRDRWVIASNNIRIYNRIREHHQIKNALSHDFSQRMQRKSNKDFFSTFLESIEHIKQPFGSSKSMSCRNCGFGVRIYLQSPYPPVKNTE